MDRPYRHNFPKSRGELRDGRRGSRHDHGWSSSDLQRDAGQFKSLGGSANERRHDDDVNQRL